MLASMTAFARHAAHTEWGDLTWVLRTVNHRYFEATWRLPDGQSALDIPLRKIAQRYVKRGKLDAQLSWQPKAEQAVTLQINQPLVSALHAAAMDVQAQAPEGLHVAPLNVLQWPGVLTPVAMDGAVAEPAIMEQFELALQALCTMRQREGEAIKQVMTERLTHMRTACGTIQQRLPAVQAQWASRLQQRLASIVEQVDADRLAQELLYYTQKSDVAEELDRLAMHLDEVERLLAEGGVIGRRLDFLMQELNRETNTLASKSVDAAITQTAVNMKVWIEQMREQIQNIE